MQTAPAFDPGALDAALRRTAWPSCARCRVVWKGANRRAPGGAPDVCLLLPGCEDWATGRGLSQERLWLPFWCVPSAPAHPPPRGGGLTPLFPASPQACGAAPQNNLAHRGRREEASFPAVFLPPEGGHTSESRMDCPLGCHGNGAFSPPPSPLGQGLQQKPACRGRRGRAVGGGDGGGKAAAPNQIIPVERESVCV